MDRPFPVGLPVRSGLFPLTSRHRVARARTGDVFRRSRVRSAGREKKEGGKKETGEKRFVIPASEGGARADSSIQFRSKSWDADAEKPPTGLRAASRRMAHYFLENRGISRLWRKMDADRPVIRGSCGCGVDDAGKNEMLPS